MTRKTNQAKISVVLTVIQKKCLCLEAYSSEAWVIFSPPSNLIAPSPCGLKAAYGCFSCSLTPLLSPNLLVTICFVIPIRITCLLRHTFLSK